VPREPVAMNLAVNARDATEYGEPPIKQETSYRRSSPFIGG
jgi:hypothetical protein